MFEKTPASFPIMHTREIKIFVVLSFLALTPYGLSAEPAPSEMNSEKMKKPTSLSLKGNEAMKCDETPSEEMLSPLQYQVMKKNGTERPFANEYWDNKAPGIYVDRLSGKALFSSLDKFDSGTGWPSFHRPLEKEEILEKADSSHGMQRVEVRSQTSDSHLGHVFPDGPSETGLRYCVNSASLKFIPLERLEEEGYGQYRKLFDEK